MYNYSVGFIYEYYLLWHPNYRIAASKLLNCGIQITENCHHPLTTCEAEPKQMRGVEDDLGTMSDSWERQVEVGASGVFLDLGKLRGHACQRARAARRAGERADLWWNPKGRGYLNIA